MTKRFDTIGVMILSWLLAGCVKPSPPEPSLPPQSSRGEVLARTNCAGCHAVGPYGSSSNPNAPPFGAIANQDGLTADTLSYWLRGAHNYPSEMNFNLDDRQVGALVAYMLTLRNPNYRRPAD